MSLDPTPSDAELLRIALDRQRRQTRTGFSMLLPNAPVPADVVCVPAPIPLAAPRARGGARPRTARGVMNKTETRVAAEQYQHFAFIALTRLRKGQPPRHGSTTTLPGFDIEVLRSRRTAPSPQPVRTDDAA